MRPYWQGLSDEDLVALLRSDRDLGAIAEAVARLLHRDSHPEDKPRPWISLEKRMPHPGDPGRPGYLGTVEVLNAVTGEEAKMEARWEFGDPKNCYFEVVDRSIGTVTHWRWSRE